MSEFRNSLSNSMSEAVQYEFKQTGCQSFEDI